MRIVAFESRRSAQIADLIHARGAQAILAPAMQEVPLFENHEALAFGKKLAEGKIDLIVFTTGVGVKALLEVLEKKWPMDQLRIFFSKIPIIGRGPKTEEALRLKGISIAQHVAEP